MTYRENADLGGLQQASVPLTLADAIYACIVVMSILCLFAIGESIDEQIPADTLLAAQAERERIAHVGKVREAYAAGQAEAMAAMASSPAGIRLAQACMANGYRRLP